MKKKITVVINRAKWRTGDSGENATGKGDTALLNEEGYKCCLGFICSLKKKKIKNYGNPEDLDFLVEELTTRDSYPYIYRDTPLTDEAVEINDNEITTPEEKESALKELFKNSRYRLKFIGKFTKYHEEE